MRNDIKKPNRPRKKLPFLLALLALISITTASAESDLKTALDKKVTVNMQDVDIRSILGLIGQQGGFPVSVSSDVEGKVSIGAANVSVKEALDQLTSENGLSYIIRDGGVYVSRGGGAGIPGGTVLSGTVHSIPLRYASCQEVSGKISQMISKGEKLITDETSNSIVFIGSDESFVKIRDMVAVFDNTPKQILIQGLIVQTSNQFLQNIGLSAGDSGRTAAGNGTATTAYMTTAGPSPANLGLLVGSIEGRQIGAAIQAAENNGEAKVISRPKIVTLNNKQAQFNSGVSFNVKTLSTVQTGQPGTSATAATGGVTTINAGLTVNILPTIVGDGEVKLLLTINDSNPDTTSLATPDGIPNIDTNSATTTVIVKSDRTAVIAGLVVDSKSTSSEGVPILKDIPVLGYLFQNHSKSANNNELAIFITPSILGIDGKGANQALYQDPLPNTMAAVQAKEAVNAPIQPPVKTAAVQVQDIDRAPASAAKP